MSFVDNRGRLFGRINLVDAFIVGFLVVLIPVAYGTYLLFRPAKPRIDSVSISILTKEEYRIASGAVLTAKLKVRGTNLNPLLRASIGNSPALGFVFENPNSADVLVGQVGPDDHDLILYDGIQEVARAAGAFRIPPTQPGLTWFIRGVGRLTNLAPNVAEGLKVGFAFPEKAPELEIIALGPIQQGRSSVRFATSKFDAPVEGVVEREAVLKIRCDSTIAENPCAVGARSTSADRVPLTFNGPTASFTFIVREVLPATSGQQARIQVRLSGGPHLASLKVGDRDVFLDERAAVVTAIDSRGPDAVTVKLDLRLDESREGWRYRDQRVRPGAPFAFATDKYEATGQIQTLDLVNDERRGGS